MDLDGVRNHDPKSVDLDLEEAAVIAPVLERSSEPHVLFTKRSEHLANHPGQMSFPGGRREPADASIKETAIREANEEVCLQREEIDFVGRLDDIQTVTEFAVHPFVARVPDRQYVPCEDEVAEIAILSVADLTDLDNYESESRDHPYYGEIRLHYFYVDGYTVWGATARMLVQLLELTTEWETPPDVDRVVEPDAEFPV